VPKCKAPKGCYWRDGILYGRIQTGGQNIRWSLRTDDPKVAAQRRKQERDRAVAIAKYGDARRTFEECLEGWGAHIERSVGPKTSLRYAMSLKQLRPFLDGVFLDEVTLELTAEIVRQRSAHGVTNATIRRDLGALSSVLNFAIDQGWRTDNPALFRLSRLKERRDPIVLPSHEDIRRVIARAPGLFSKMIAAALWTGCREDELVKAKRSQLDHLRRQLSVVGKGNKVRVIDLDGWGYEEVFASLPAFLGQPWLFWHHDGEPYRTTATRFRTLVASVAKQAQKQTQQFVPFRFHDLRHRHAVDWLKSGRSIYDLQQRLGHTSVKTTEGYLAYLTPEEKRMAMYGQTQKQPQE
jgi:integrase/recombinase XerD